jgi:DNA-directed RNA polymerase specialized sigma24 family protein
VVLSLYLLEGYDHQEIAQVLGITEVASRTHLMRGKKQLQELLKEEQYVEGY